MHNVEMYPKNEQADLLVKYNIVNDITMKWVLILLSFLFAKIFFFFGIKWYEWQIKPVTLFCYIN